MASDISYLQANNIKVGTYVVVKEKPCKIVEVSWSKPGKHGSAKINFTGLDMFTGKKVEGMCQSSHMVEVPTVTRQEAEVLNMSEEYYLSLLMEDNTTRADIRARNPEIAGGIRSALEDGHGVRVVIMSALGKDEVASFKVEK
eukprot:TRINITY_DN4312_c0_g1_i2.p1 TRINITY_DN4312_c0_g1~~TRINITY_DN4312_c0_g1_i2.p1  ORF type:complete len:143 (+),score=42.36 TRINITY_DN4312_c0_g1_i2:149-577(+)